jgi:hypothetical protein
VATSQASTVRRTTRWRRPYTTDPQVNGKAVPAATTRVSEAADHRRRARWGLDHVTRTMAATRAPTPTSDAATCSWLTRVGPTPGGSFGATPAVTAAIPATPTSRLTGRRPVAAGSRSAHAVSVTSRPTATMADRTIGAKGWPGEASRLTVS